jgi:hypothetical protein
MKSITTKLCLVAFITCLIFIPQIYTLESQNKETNKMKNPNSIQISVKTIPDPLLFEKVQDISGKNLRKDNSQITNVII